MNGVLKWVEGGERWDEGVGYQQEHISFKAHIYKHMKTYTHTHVYIV